jgi:hypothetical protein
MNHTLIRIAFVFFIAVSFYACKKSNDDTKTPAQFQPITFKFGPDSTAIAISTATQVIKNLPLGVDPTQLTAGTVLPSGSSISPNPSSVQDYTKGVTFTVTNSNGQSYNVQITAPAYDAVTNPYGIYTPKQLSGVRNGLNYSYVLMNDIQLPDLNTPNSASVAGISDYNLYGWFSIGTKYVNGGDVIFRGTLDGQNHLIKNLSIKFRPGGNPPAGIDASHQGRSCDGLFGFANHASFKNIGIQLADAGIMGIDPSGDGVGFTGSLVGLADSSTISNCFVTGAGSVTSHQFTAGLIGTSRTSKISKCYAALTAAAGHYSINSGGEAGGLIGYAYDSEVSDSYSSCSVQTSVNAGGLIGRINTCTIKTSYATGNVSETPYDAFGSLIASNAVGGLIGTVSSVAPFITTIQNCFATGAVAGANGVNIEFHKSSRIGGLVGQIASSSGPVSFTNCYAAGAVTRFWTNAAAPFYTGGLAGITPNGVFVSNGTSTNYWDKTTTGQTNLGGANGALAQDNAFTANGKTSSEMKTQATYSNWDFAGIWNAAAGTNNGYPYLRNVAR